MLNERVFLPAFGELFKADDFSGTIIRTIDASEKKFRPAPRESFCRKFCHRSDNLFAFYPLDTVFGYDVFTPPERPHFFAFAPLKKRSGLIPPTRQVNPLAADL